MTAFVIHIFCTDAHNTIANANDGESRICVEGSKTIMAKSVVPEAREGLNRFKMEAAGEVGVNLKQGYNGDLTARQAGSIGGQMVKKMIQAYEQSNLK